MHPPWPRSVRPARPARGTRCCRLESVCPRCRGCSGEAQPGAGVHEPAGRPQYADLGHRGRLGDGRAALAVQDHETRPGGEDRPDVRSTDRRPRTSASGARDRLRPPGPVIRRLGGAVVGGRAWGCSTWPGVRSQLGARSLALLAAARRPPPQRHRLKPRQPGPSSRFLDQGASASTAIAAAGLGGGR